MQDLSDGMKSVESEQDNARGPRLIRRWTPPLVRGGLATSATTPSSGLVPCVADRTASMMPHLQSTSPNTQADAERPIHRVASPHTNRCLQTAHQGCACAVLRLCTAPDRLSQAENQPPQSATSRVVSHCRCRKRRLPTPSHTAPMVAMQHRPPWSATSRQTATKRRPLATNKKVDAST